MRYFFITFLFITFLFISLDIISKNIASSLLQEQIQIIPNFLSFQYAQNSGIAFSIPLTGVLLKIVTVILIFGIFWYYWTEEKRKKSLILNLSYSLIFAGALGNGWERIFVGYVTDFISIEGFAIFNIADSYITLGAFGILYYYWKNRK